MHQHKKNFAVFANNLKELNGEQVGSFLKALSPQNIQEHVFRIELCMRFESFEILYEYLVSGHGLLSKIVARNVRFARMFVGKFDGKEFVGKVCPEISCVNRYRFVYKLIKVIGNDALGDDYFVSVIGKYGLKLATPFLIVCSERIIREAVEEYQVELNQLQLLKIHKKFDGFLKFYLQSCERKLGDDKKLGGFLISYDLKGYHELVKEFGAPVLGKRSFNKYLKAYKEEIIVNEMFKRKQIKQTFHSLSKIEFNAYFKQFFRKIFDENLFIQYAKALPFHSRESLLLDLFNNVYSGETFQVNSSLLEIFSSNDRLKYLNEESDIVLFACEKSVPVIIEKLILTNNTCEWIPKLIKTCRVNNDTLALLNILQMFFNEHKQHFLTFKRDFLINLKKEYDLQRLSEQHWILIERLIKETMDENGLTWWESNILLNQLLLHKVIHNMDYESVLEILVKFRLLSNMEILNNNPKLLRKCLLKIPDIYQKLNITDSGKYFVFLYEIYKFNNKTTRFEISPYAYPQYFQKVFETIDNDKIYQLHSLRYLLNCEVKNPAELQVRDKYMKLYLEKCIEYKYVDYEYLLKYDPEKLAVRDYFDNGCTFHNRINRLNFLKVDVKLKQIALDIINNPCSKHEMVIKAVTYLSYSDNFLNAIEHLHPKPDNLRLDLEDPDLARKFEIHRTILTGLKFQSHPQEMIETVLYYCQGDYLKHALGPLYFIVHHSPEKYIRETLEKFLSSNLSRRKHASYLATNVCDIETAYSILQQIGHNENHTYVLKFLIRRHLKFFCENPNIRIWDLFVKHLSLPGVNLKDGETVLMLLNCKKVPHNYHSKYIETIWNIAKARELETELLPFISTDLFKKFPNNFCDEIVKDCLFKEQSINDLVYEYLNDSDSYAERWSNVGEIIMAETNMEMTDLHKPLAKIDGFLESMCRQIINNKSYLFASNLRNSVKNLHTTINKFYYENLLEVTEFLVKSNNSLLPNILQKQYLNLVNLYGDEMLDPYVEFVKKLYNEILPDCTSDKTTAFLNLCEALLNLSSSNETIRLVNVLMPNGIKKHNKLNQKLQENVVAKILQNSDGEIPLDLLMQFPKHKRELQQFLPKFHNLGGRNITEHRRNFSLFANCLKQLSGEQVTSFLTAVTPQNIQEHVFRIELCSRFEMFEILYEYLVSGHRLLSKIVARDVRFARMFVRKFDGQQFVINVCPEISSVNRYRLAYKLIKAIADDPLGDDYFVSIKDKYGLKLATPFLVVCSERIVRQAVEEYQVELNQLQLLKIHKKFDGFLRFYLKSCETKFFDHKNLGGFLVRSDVKSYHELVKEFGAPALGKRSFGKYLRAYKEEIIVSDMFKARQMKNTYYTLSKQEFNVYFKQFFSNNFNEYLFMKFAKALPANSREQLLVDLFKNRYNGKSFEVTSDLLEIFSLNDRLKYLNEDSDIVLFACEKSIPVIIEKLLTSNNENEWIPKLIKTCKINNNPQALLNMLRMFFDEHKNKFLIFRSAFLIALKSECNMQKLSEQHWILIEKLIKDTMGEEKISWSDSNLLLEQLLLYRVSQDGDYESALQMFLKRGYSINWYMFHKDQKLLRKCLLKIPKLYEKLDITDKYFEFLCEISKMNSKHQISPYAYPQYFQKIFDTLNYDKRYYLYGMCAVLLCKPKNPMEVQVRDKYVKLYLEKSIEYKYSNNNYLLKENPEKLTTVNLFESENYVDAAFFDKISRLNFLQVDTKLKQDALNILNDSNRKNDTVIKAIKYLSRTDNFLNTIDHLHPAEDSLRLNLEEPDLAHKFEIHKTILTGLKFQSYPHEMIKTILYYCRGDYLKHALGPLYFIIHHSPEKYIHETLEKFLDSALSTRKHASYLATSVCDIETAYSVLSRIGRNESHPYVMKFLIRRHLKFFCENPSDRLWNLFVIHLSSPAVNLKDVETVQKLLDCKKIPRKYQSKYIETIWKIAKARILETSILPCITEDLFKKFPNNFCDDMIQSCLFKEDTIYHLVYDYLNDSDMFAERWGKIAEVIKTLLVNVETVDLREPLAKIESFLQDLCFRIIIKKSNILASNLINSMKNLQVNVNKFYFEILLEATEYLTRSDTILLPNFLHKHYLNLIDLYGDEILYAFAEFVKKFYNEVHPSVRNSSDNTTTFLNVCESLLDLSSSNETIRLVIILMPNDIKKNNKLNQKLQENVVAKILQNSDGEIPLDLLKQFPKQICHRPGPLPTHRRLRHRDGTSLLLSVKTR